MKRLKTCASEIVAVALPLLLLLTSAEALAQFQLRSQAFSAVGGTASATGTNLLATGGQAHPIGTSSSPNFILNPGFIPSIARIIVLNPTEDAYVNSNNASTNFGTAPTLRAKLSSPIVNSYLKFVVAGISGTIQSAKLRLKVNAASNNNESVYFVANNSWTELGITFNNAPPISGSPLSTASSGTVGQWVEFNVIATPNLGNGTFSFGLKSASTTTVQYILVKGEKVTKSFM